MSDMSTVWNMPQLQFTPNIIQFKNEGDVRFFAILKEMWELHCKKGNDYGSNEDFLANLRSSEAFGIPAWVGALVRCNDKMIRLENLAKGNELENENAIDSFNDGACYFILARILFEETNAE